MNARFRLFALVLIGMLASVATFASHPSEDSEWNGANDPHTWGSGYNYVLNTLPLKGEMTDHRPWSDTYWPTNLAGIAARWNWPGSNGFRYETFKERDVRAMSLGQLARLSPAEKYDIYMGRFNYPTVESVRGSTSRRAADWHGICDGWSSAALNHAEPAAVTVTGPSGIAVPFGSADVKALMDSYYADNLTATHFLGVPCKAGTGWGRFRRRGSSMCDDVNPGAFHVILTNEIGLQHKGFVADRDHLGEVWNQPVYGFETSISGSGRVSEDNTRGTARVVRVHTRMLYTNEIEPNWEPVVGTSMFNEGVGEYDYTLELDSQGRIIGGEWISGDHPDFLWTVEKLEFTGYFSGINAIYTPAPKH